jgi:SAM-dependent methyltransferase
VSEAPASPLDRLFAGGRPESNDGRLLVLGRPPERVLLQLEGWERVACIASRDEDIRPGTVRADAHHLPFTEALFDKALLSAPLVQPRLMLRELWRVLAPAGLAVLVVQARWPWQSNAHGWQRAPLALRLEEAMFEVLDWRVQHLPARHHVVLLEKCDGVRPVLVGEAEPALATAPAV